MRFYKRPVFVMAFLVLVVSTIMQALGKFSGEYAALVGGLTVTLAGVDWNRQRNDDDRSE